MARKSDSALFLVLLGSWIALMLSVMPLPLIHAMRPDFVAIWVAFCAIFYPRNMPMWSACVIGLLQDFLQLSFLGQHALGLVMLVYLIQTIRPWLTILSAISQIPIMLIIFLVLQLLYGWISAIGFSRMIDPVAFASPLLSALLIWPILSFALAKSSHQQRFNEE